MTAAAYYRRIAIHAGEVFFFSLPGVSLLFLQKKKRNAVLKK
jgi:hypothetical protein